MSVEDVGVRLKLAGKQKFSGDMKGAAGDVKNLGDKAERASEQARKSADRWKTFGKVAAAGAVAAGAALAALAVSSVLSASALEQSVGGVQSVFGAASGTVMEFASNAAQSVGLAKSEYASLAAVVGSQLQRMGQSQADSAVSTDKLITLGADLAATYGGSVSDAVGAVSSLLRGERDPIERYAVGIKQADIDARLAAEGLGELTGAARTQAEAQATLALLYGQTTNAQGAFNRESDTLAGTQERLRAQVEDVKAGIGVALLPVMQSLASWLNTEGVPAVERFGAWFTGEGSQGLKDFASDAAAKVQTAAQAVGDAFDWAKKNAEWLTPVLVGLAATMVTLSIANTIAGFYRAWAAATATQTTLQWLLNAAMTANPIGLVIALIAGLVAGFVVAYKNSETFRDIVNGAFATIKEGAVDMAQGILWVVDKILAGYQMMAGAAGKLPGPLGAPFRAAEEAIGKARGKLDSFSSALDGLTKPRTVTVNYQQVGSVTAVPYQQRAMGGPVNAGQPYIVGELRPEVFVPNVSGRIEPRVTPAALRGVSLPRQSMPEGATLGGDGGALLGGDRPIIVRIDLDGRTIAEAQAEAVADRRARR